jgi:uncharacterized protein (TIGR00251 family)
MKKKDFLQLKDNKVVLYLSVKPNSQKQQIIYDKDENKLTIFLKSPPDKGKANKELIKYLAKILNLSSSDVTLIFGHTSREKAVLIQNNNLSMIREKLANERS